MYYYHIYLFTPLFTYSFILYILKLSYLYTNSSVNLFNYLYLNFLIHFFTRLFSNYAYNETLFLFVYSCI